MAKRYKSKKNKTGRIIRAILILCVFSALIGFYGVKFMLGGNGNSESTETSEEASELKPLDEFAAEPESEILEIEEENEKNNGQDSLEETDKVDESDSQIEDKKEQINVNLYAYQLGGFSSIENAETFLNELKENGETGVILKENNYKVLNFVYGNSALDEYFKGLAKDIVSDAFLVKIGKTIQVSYPESEEEKLIVCIKDYERALSIIGEVQADYIDYLNENLSRNALIEKITKGVSEIDNMKKRVGKLDSDDVFLKKLGPWYESMIKAFQEEVKLQDGSLMMKLSELYISGTGSN